MMDMLKKTSGWLPIAMSLSAIVLVLGYVLMFGTDTQETQDEGLAARIFQLLLVGQIPIVIYFALRWLPKNARFASPVLALQIAMAMTAFALVFFLEM
jgi:uncharacterized membrane protein